MGQKETQAIKPYPRATAGNRDDRDRVLHIPREMQGVIQLFARLR